jgi:hypothetical protein
MRTQVVDHQIHLDPLANREKRGLAMKAQYGMYEEK